MNRAGPSRHPVELIAMLAAVSAIAPFSIHVYAPVLPLLKDDLSASLAQAQWTMSAPQIALAPALLAFGWAADALGRRRTLIFGLGIFALGTVTCYLAADITTMIAGRVLCAVGASAGFVISRTVVADQFDSTRIPDALAYLTMIMVVVPSVAPILGASLAGWFGWRSIFLILLGAAMAAAAWYVARSPGEPREGFNEAEGRRSDAGSMRAVRRLAANRRFMGFVLQTSFTLGIFLSFVATAPHLVDAMGGSPSDYGRWFALVAAAYFLGNFGSTMLFKSIDPARLVFITTLVGSVAIACMVYFVLWGQFGQRELFLPMALLIFANGFATPRGQGGALVAAGRDAGIAAGLIGFIQMVVAGIAIQSVAWTALPPRDGLLTVISTCSALALISIFGAMTAPRRASPARAAPDLIR